MKKNKCIVCGKEATTTIKLDHGELNLCSKEKCTKILNLRINKSLPILSVGKNDFKENGQKEFIDNLNDNEIIKMVKDVHDMFFLDDENFTSEVWRSYHYSLEVAHRIYVDNKSKESNNNGN